MSGPRAARTALFTLLVLLAGAPGLAGLARAAESCDAPAELTAATDPLRQAARAIASRAALRVLVIGTASSTQGGTSAPTSTYPLLLAEALRRHLPQVEVTVETRGGRGLVAAELETLLEGALAEFHPDLVIWQTGTVDAVNGVDSDAFAATLREGIDRAAAAHADVILMDQQFSRLGRATVNFIPYRQAMETVANATDAALLRRYELTRHWAETGQIDLERAPRADWQRIADQLHACLARALSKAILAGVREAKR